MTLFEKEQGLRRRIGSDYLIGCYSLKENGRYCIMDVRGEHGHVLDFENQNEIEILYENRNLKLGVFYKFRWGLNNQGQIIVKESPKTLDSHEFLRGLYNSRTNLEGEVLKTFNDFQATIFNEVTGAQHTYLYELLQNANDYPYKNEKVKVKFLLTDHYLFFLHSGAPFNLRNIVGICSINQGEKRKNTKTIGYKGIGFKSVFVRNNIVYLKSGDWQLRFDEGYSNKLYFGKSPWALIPIPTSNEELDREVESVLSESESSLRVKFALRHRNDANEHIPQLDKVFSDNQILLFIPNVIEVEVIVKGKLRHHVIKDEDKWCVKHYDNYKVPEELKKYVEANINSGDKIPEKFKNIETIRISFAVSRNGKKITPVPDARVYNYLPTELKLGFPFLFNADFVPNGSRNGLHPVMWNDHVMTQCGRYFAHWWASFMEKVDEFDLQSVFDILPSFNSNDNYAMLFTKGFWVEIQQIPCIPTLKNGYHLCKLNDIVYDKIGFVGTKNPVMTDEEFYTIVYPNHCLPHPAIRESELLNKLLDRLKDGVVFNGNNLTNLYFNPEFRAWLRDKKKYLSFFNFIVSKDFIVNFLSYKIFRKWDGTLATPETLFYEIDLYFENIDFLSDELDYLDQDLRKILDLSQSRNNIRGKFRKFLPDSFALQILGKLDAYRDKFLSLDNNVKFIHFLANMGYTRPLTNSYPFITNDNTIHENKDTLYQHSKEGEQLKQHEWIEKNWIKFLHPAYTEKSSEKVSTFLEKQNIAILTSKVGYERIISQQPFLSSIAKNIQHKNTNIDFFQYLYSIQDCGIGASFNEEMRKNYRVLTHDASGNAYWSTINQTIFWESEIWHDIASASWMIDGLCLALDNAYLSEIGHSERDSFKKFLNIKQITQEFSVNGLYSGKLRSFAGDILSGITTIEKSYDFLLFLYENRKNLKDTDKVFKGIPIKCQGNQALIPLDPSGEANTYISSKDMIDLCTQPWLDVSYLRIADKKYNDLFDNKEANSFFTLFGLTTISKKDYVVNEILPFIENLKPRLIDRNNNLSFHRFFISLSSVLSDKEWEVVKGMPIYISSNTSEDGELAGSSTDHYIPTTVLQEAINLDIVPTEIMDSIHPSYIQGQDDIRYFVDKLGNVEIDIEKFICYLLKNAEIVIPYLKEKERNIRFWRWICPQKELLHKCDKETITELHRFPILIKGAENNIEPFGKVESLYLSDEYSKSPMETFVSRFVKGAKFISDIYIAKEEETNRVQLPWASLFGLGGVKTDIKDIVLTKVIPNLNQYEEIDIVLLLSKYYADIKSRLTGKENIKFHEELSHLQLLCEDGSFREVSEVLIAGVYFDYKDSSLPEISITNIVCANYINKCGDDNEQRRSVSLFMRLLADEFKVGLENATKLLNTKIHFFLTHQELFSKEETHYNIILQLADIFEKDWEGIVKLIENCTTTIKLYSENGEFLPASSLTLHSIYNPDCDFAGHGITSQRRIVTPAYGQHSPVIVGHFLKFLSVHHKFKENDLELLRIEEFANYFWGNYALSHKDWLSSICTEKKLSIIPCIPSPAGVKRPSELYDPKNKLLEKIVKMLPGGANKLPNVKLPEWIEKIGLLEHLSFKDCLAFLSLNLPKHDFRKDIYKWMAQTPDNTIRNEKANIEKARESLLWFNGQKLWVPLKDLYALEWSDGKSPLKDNFSTNGGICNPASMPNTRFEYERLCSILDIKVLTDNDFVKHKDTNAIRDLKAIREIRKRLLYLAYKAGSNWREKYAEHCERLDKVDISKCESISYSFNEQISTELYAYCESPSQLWYVGEWDGSMFVNILNWLKKNFNLSKDDSYLNKLFLTPFNKFVAKEENGSVPQELLDFLSDEDKSGLEAEKVETTEEFEEDDNIQNNNREIDESSQASAEIEAEEDDNQQSEIEKFLRDETFEDDGEREALKCKDSITRTEDFLNLSRIYFDYKGQEIETVCEHYRLGTWVRGHLRNGFWVNGYWRGDAIVGSHSRIADHSNLHSDLPQSNIYKEESTRQNRSCDINNHTQNHSRSRTNASYTPKASTPEQSSVYNLSLENDRPSLKERLNKKWSQKKNKTVGKPGTSESNVKYQAPLPEKPSINERPNEPFFEPESTMGNRTYSVSGNPSGKTAANIKKRNTEARQRAESADDEMALYDLFLQAPKFSFLWFKYLMELKFGDKGKVVPRSIQLDFLDYDLSENQQIVGLYNPNKAVPRWLEHADNVSVQVIGKSTVNLQASIIKVDPDHSNVELLINYKDACKLDNCGKIRIDATYSTNIVDSLTTRFLQMDFDDDFNMEKCLPANIEFIYGPPGTGKTTRLVERIQDLIKDSENGTNILVLTPTNKAADVIATKLAENSTCYDYLTRFGATESRYLIEDAAVVQTRDTLDMALLPKNIVVTTAARYAYDYVQPDDTPICEFNWNYIVIDEASMMDLVTIIYVLFNGKPAQFIIAGDPKQITPVKENNIEESELNIYDMVALDDLQEAIKNYDRYPIEALTTQYRSVPSIGKLVSDFAYNGIVEPYLKRLPQKPLDLDGIPIKDINFIGFKTQDLDMLYGLTSINDSAFHLYSAIFTYNFVDYMVQQLKKKYPNSHYSIGVVCPYKAQAEAIQQMVDSRSLNNEVCEVITGTVHKFQGDECDIMIAVFNPPINCTSGAHINNENIINVAMSRARDYLFFIIPDRQIDKFHMRERLGNLVENSTRKLMYCPDLEKIMFGNSNYIGENTCVTCHMPVNVYYDNKAKYEVRIDDTTLDIQIND